MKFIKFIALLGLLVCCMPNLQADPSSQQEWELAQVDIVPATQLKNLLDKSPYQRFPDNFGRVTLQKIKTDANGNQTIYTKLVTPYTWTNIGGAVLGTAALGGAAYYLLGENNATTPQTVPANNNQQQAIPAPDEQQATKTTTLQNSAEQNQAANSGIFASTTTFQPASSDTGFDTGTPASTNHAGSTAPSTTESTQPAVPVEQSYLQQFSQGVSDLIRNNTGTIAGIGALGATIYNSKAHAKTQEINKARRERNDDIKSFMPEFYNTYFILLLDPKNDHVTYQDFDKLNQLLNDPKLQTLEAIDNIIKNRKPLDTEFKQVLPLFKKIAKQRLKKLQDNNAAIDFSDTQQANKRSLQDLRSQFKASIAKYKKIPVEYVNEVHMQTIFTNMIINLQNQLQILKQIINDCHSCDITQTYAYRTFQTDLQELTYITQLGLQHQLDSLIIADSSPSPAGARSAEQYNQLITSSASSVGPTITSMRVKPVLPKELHTSRSRSPQLTQQEEPVIPHDWQDADNEYITHELERRNIEIKHDLNTIDQSWDNLAMSNSGVLLPDAIDVAIEKAKDDIAAEPSYEKKTLIRAQLNTVLADIDTIEGQEHARQKIKEALQAEDNMLENWQYEYEWIIGKTRTQANPTWKKDLGIINELELAKAYYNRFKESPISLISHLQVNPPTFKPEVKQALMTAIRQGNPQATGANIDKLDRLIQTQQV